MEEILKSYQLDRTLIASASPSKTVPIALENESKKQIESLIQRIFRLNDELVILNQQKKKIGQQVREAKNELSKKMVECKLDSIQKNGCQFNLVISKRQRTSIIVGVPA